MKVIIAVDGSELSEKSFNWYLDSCYKPVHEIVAAYCMELPIVLGGSAATTVIYDQMLAEKHQEAQAVREKFGNLLKNRKIGGRFVSAAHARPCEWLVDLAKSEKAQLVVTGSRGQGVVRRTILGSVSNYVLHHTHCPVMIYHDHNKKHKHS